MFDWLGRTLLLILSGLATFAIIASLGSASRGAGMLAPGIPPLERPSAALPTDRSTEPEAPPRALATPGPRPTGQVRVAAPAPAPSRSPEDRIAALLEALTYAMLALAGFAAAILIVLLRITGYLARIAARS